MDNHLHIVSLDIPYPADYGGVIDIFYKIKALHESGIKIHLHCFAKNIKAQPELNKYCVSVNYYLRKKNFLGFSVTTPYIVQSRSSKELIYNLKKDNHPILLEGIHCTYLLKDKDFANRNIFIRLHNVENLYYKNLAHQETNLLKKLYFLNESKLLKNYEKRVANKALLFAISESDLTYYKTVFNSAQIEFIPTFIPFDKVICKDGLGNYCLYHGNLSVNENEVAAIWLLQNVFSQLQIPFVIAGKNPSQKLVAIAKKYNNCSIIINPLKNEIESLIANAQINVLPSFNNTGVKLKLLSALFIGKHCIVNAASLAGSQLQSLCVVADDKDSFKNNIEKLFLQPFTNAMILQRIDALKINYDNGKSAKKIISHL